MKCSPSPAGFAKGLLLLIPLLGLFACASQSGPAKSHKILQKTIREYNDAFKAKRPAAAEPFVQRDIRELFKEKYSEIKKRVTFDEMEPMKIEYFKDGVAVKQSDPGPEEDFNEAVLTVRYSVVISPSNRVKTITVRQKWTRENDGRWVVVPNLEPFSR
ncbi:MAG: hypothetical protein ACE5G9_01555 [Nitrospinales bacterium]